MDYKVGRNSLLSAGQMQKLILRHDIRANDLLVSNSNRLYPHRSNVTLSLQYQYKGSTVTGKLAKRAPNGSDAKPIWIVTPSNRRCKNEEIPEKALGKIIGAQEVTTNRGPKLKKTDVVALGSSPSSRNCNSNSYGSLGGGKKSLELNVNSGSEIACKVQKTETFSRESNTTTPSKINTTKAKRAKVQSTRIGTRSTRGSGEAVLLLEPIIKRKMIKGKTVRKDDNVTVVKMLTGTLYLFRGDRPRAEFVRFK